MEYKIGDIYQGKDCNHQQIRGKVIKILDNTMIIEDGVLRYLVKKINKKMQRKKNN